MVNNIKEPYYFEINTKIIKGMLDIKKMILLLEKEDIDALKEIYRDGTNKQLVKTNYFLVSENEEDGYIVNIPLLDPIFGRPSFPLYKQ